MAAKEPKDPKKLFVEPTFGEDNFHCPHCGVWSHQTWFHARVEYGGNTYGTVNGVMFSICQRCHEYAVWVKKAILHPATSMVPMPSVDMPEDVKADYMEARDVFPKSARAAGGLLRVAFEKLMPHLGVTKTDPNGAIGELVQKGLVLGTQQQAMDVVRIFGNQAVHNGFVKLEDQPATVSFLFGLMNYIVEQLITRPKEINSLYATLPKEKLEGIANRDKTK